MVWLSWMRAEEEHFQGGRTDMTEHKPWLKNLFSGETQKVAKELDPFLCEVIPTNSRQSNCFPFLGKDTDFCKSTHLAISVWVFLLINQFKRSAFYIVINGVIQAQNIKMRVACMSRKLLQTLTHKTCHWCDSWLSDCMIFTRPLTEEVTQKKDDIKGPGIARNILQALRCVSSFASALELRVLAWKYAWITVHPFTMQCVETCVLLSGRFSLTWRTLPALRLQVGPA